MYFFIWRNRVGKQLLEILPTICKTKAVKQTEVLSPTFNLLYEYDIKDYKVMHHDLYRIKNKMNQAT